jgi:hypothetical protein
MSVNPPRPPTDDAGAEPERPDLPPDIEAGAAEPARPDLPPDIEAGTTTG